MGAKGTERGRPTRLTPETIEAVAKLLRSGAYFDTAVASLGIPRSTARDWLRRGRDGEARYRPFSDACEKASAQAEIMALEEIRAAGRARRVPVNQKERTVAPDGTVQEIEWRWLPGEWQANMTFLERRFPDRWGRRERVQQEVTGAGGGPVTQAITLRIIDPQTDTEPDQDATDGDGDGDGDGADDAA